MDKKIVLASGSKRRSEILRSCRIRHKVVVSNAEEKSHHHLGPAKLALENARLKAETVAGRFKKGIILGVDTVVLFKQRIIGKPKNKLEARKLLQDFSGNRISVYTGICLIDQGRNKNISGFEKSKLNIRKIKDKDLNRYLKLLGPYDKAGGFSIEGAGSLIFDDVRGSYFNVLGLPMARLGDLFKGIGLDLLDFIR